MSSIDRLTSKIIEDAEAKAKAIIDEARAKEEILINSKVEEAEVQRKAILQKAEEEAKTRGERVISNAELQVRNMKLKIKQEVLDKVFTEALEKLSKISYEKTLQFIKDGILSAKLTSEVELVLGEGTFEITEEFIKDINSSLENLDTKGRVKLSLQRRKIKGGFILSSNGVEINNSFDALIKNAREELEAEVANILFK